MNRKHSSASSVLVLAMVVLSLYSSLTCVQGFPQIPSQSEDTEYTYDDDNDDGRDALSTDTNGNGIWQLARFVPLRRGIGKRHVICDPHHSVCERCAKHTKSHAVYLQCCQSDEERKWCNDFIAYEIGKK